MMNELFDIMCKFTDVEYGLQALGIVLESLEEHYCVEHQKKLRANTIVFMRQVESLQKELSGLITDLDKYLQKEE